MLKGWFVNKACHGVARTSFSTSTPLLVPFKRIARYILRFQNVCLVTELVPSMSSRTSCDSLQINFNVKLTDVLVAGGTSGFDVHPLGECTCNMIKLSLIFVKCLVVFQAANSGHMLETLIC